jgi:hypothetical protein
VIRYALEKGQILSSHKNILHRLFYFKNIEDLPEYQSQFCPSIFSQMAESCRT